MDKKKKISAFIALAIATLFLWPQNPMAQTKPDKIQFCDKQYKEELGKDSITLFLKAIDREGNHMTSVNASDLVRSFTLVEDGKAISNDRWTVETLTNGKRIPANFTISVLVDLSIGREGKESIYAAIKQLLESTHEGSVYLSFFGNVVSSSQLVTKENIDSFKSQFEREPDEKCIYSALYAKLSEFNWTYPPLRDSIRKEGGYEKNQDINNRASNASEGENLLFLFTEGHIEPTIEYIDYPRLQEYLNNEDYARITPKVYAFFFDTGNGIDPNLETFLKGITTPRDANHEIIKKRQGAYMSSNNMRDVVGNFEQAVRNEMYDFALSYRVPENKVYTGRVDYEALWDGLSVGKAAFDIGTPENSWPHREAKASESVVKYLVALFVTLLTIILFIVVMKILIPGIKSKTFEAKYYNRYKPRDDVKKLTCPLCRCEILPGEMIVTKCKHLMHVRCWKDNDYKCVEYGQNCKDGIQDHVHWDDLFTKHTLRDCYLAIMGIVAGLFSWVIYELTGNGMFEGLATNIVDTFFKADETNLGIVSNCITKVSAFLSIGLLLGFFLSLIFRYNDGVKRKDWKSLLEIIGLSILTSLIGMAAFALGGIILCLWLSPTDTTIPWYCSFPAYLLFSVCTSLALTIKSSIPIKSALLGGLVSSIIGFIVLYFSSITNKNWEYMNMLLNFVIYGGGLGASLVTVRMLAEKYFLVVTNGIRSGLRIPIHKWMNATGGGNIVTIGMTQRCEIMMNWEKSNKVAKEHVQLYVDHERSQAMMRPLANTVFNMRTELTSTSKPVPLSNGDTIKVGDTIFQYVEN